MPQYKQVFHSGPQTSLPAFNDRKRESIHTALEAGPQKEILSLVNHWTNLDFVHSKENLAILSDSNTSLHSYRESYSKPCLIMNPFTHHSSYFWVWLIYESPNQNYNWSPRSSSVSSIWGQTSILFKSSKAYSNFPTIAYSIRKYSRLYLRMILHVYMANIESNKYNRHV
jgi:hypothetical protein